MGEQWDNLTILLLLVFIGLVCTAGYLWFVVQERETQVSSLEHRLAFREKELRVVIGERDTLQAAIDDLVATVDLQDRDSGTMWGPARSKIEELRQRRMT
jgi:hypothetical protein